MASHRQTWANLDAELLRAHATGDLGAMIELYGLAGDAAFAVGDVDAGCFYTTQAYVFALQAGANASKSLHAKLVLHRRET